MLRLNPNDNQGVRYILSLSRTAALKIGMSLGSIRTP
jgi:hypothetical protein